MHSKPSSVILYLLINQVVSLFSHTNVKVPEKIDQLLRLIIITPSLHRIHHSIVRHECDSNYGALFSFWDRIFATFCKKPSLDYENMVFGITSFRSKKDLWLDQLLLQPFKKG